MINIHNIKVLYALSPNKLIINGLFNRIYSEKTQQLHEVITESDKKIRITTTKPITEGNIFIILL